VCVCIYAYFLMHSVTKEKIKNCGREEISF
jgi:hypothetical protein